MSNFQRNSELEQIKEILSSPKAEFIYVRGRRRIGKSWLLSDLQTQWPDCFFFTGDADSSSKQTINKMAEQWSAFSKTDELLHRRDNYLTWQKIFDEMLNYAKTGTKKITLIFDEIQWIAKKGNGFIGNLKSAWVPWQKSGLFNVIICGSSNKFFHDHVGGEEKILRGLQTAATVWVPPIDLTTLCNQFAPHWKMQEVAMLYMMTGGVPYYLERIDASKPFIHAINQAFFTKTRNLQNETTELLSLEFNKLGISNVLRLLVSLGQTGSSHKNIAIKTGLSKPTITKLLDHLVDYNLVYVRRPYLRRRRENEDLERYYMKDFFLNWYFQVLRPLDKDIAINDGGLLFPYKTGLSDAGFYIPNFTGAAFELLIRHLLENERSFSSRFFKKIDLYDPSYLVHDYWDQQTQIDLLVEHTKDRVLRVIDCKWSDNWDDTWIDQIKSKSCPMPDGYTRRDYIIVPKLPGASATNKAQAKNVMLIGLEDLAK